MIPGPAPALTIVTPSMNQGRFIERTILSVLEQSVAGAPAVEHLVFDGGSADETPAILRRYAERGAVRTVSEPDRGQAHAVNKGFRAARGDVVGWINSDDVFYPGAFATVLRAFAERPDVEVIYGDADYIDARDRVIAPYPVEDWSYARLQETCFVCQPAVFFRRRLLDEVGLLAESLHYCMDYEYWLRIGGTRPFHRIPARLAGSRLHEDSKTVARRVAVHDEIVRMLRARRGPGHVRWILNLAHAIVDAEGRGRATPRENFAYVRRLVPVALHLLRRVSRAEILRLLRWWAGAALAALPARRG